MKTKKIILRLWYAIRRRDETGLPLRTVALLGVVLMALAVSQPAQAQNARSVHVVSVEIFSDPQSATLCVGQTKTFTIRVWRQLEVSSTDGTTTQPRELAPEFAIDSQVPDATVGTFVYGGPQRNSGARVAHPPRVTRYDRGLLPQYVFKATKVGTVVLEFTAKIPAEYPADRNTATVRVPVTVIDCAYTVSATVNYTGAKLAQVRIFEGQMFPVRLAAGSGDLLTATSTLWWTEDITEAGCAVSTMPRLLVTAANISATLSEDGLAVTIAFDPVSHTTCGACEGMSVCLPDSWGFDTVNAIFPATGGGSSTQTAGPFTITVQQDDAGGTQ